MLRAVFQWYHCRRFAGLFITLLLTLAGYPLLKTLGFGFGLLEVLLVVNLAAATASLGRERGFRMLLVLGLAFLALRGLQALMDSGGLLPLAEALWVLACTLAGAAAARHALGVGAMNSERIFAALDVYLLAGLVFSVGYWTLDQIWPSSFVTADEFNLGQAIYFSFVTLATLGYGDIVPVSDAARGLAILEAVGGQMYIAVLIARMVSLYARESDLSHT